MQTSADPELQLPPGWHEVLTRVEEALAVAATDTARREQALQAAPPTTAPAAAAGAGVLQGLDRCRTRVCGLTECAGQADASAAETDAALGGAEDALQAWFQAAEAMRRTLANWAAGT